MKISKATQWILVIGIVAVLIVGLAVVYGRQRTEQNQLNSDIVKAQQDFLKYSAQKKDLEPKLGQAKSRVADAQSKFSLYNQAKSVEINEDIFQTADDTNVVITSLSSSLPGGETINGIAYRVFSLGLTVQGENIVALLNFSNKLSERFPVATIGGVSIGVGEPSTLNLGMKVYTYEAK